MNFALYGAGTLYNMFSSDMNRVRSQYVRSYRCVLRLPCFEAGGPTDEDVMSAALRPVVSVVLRAARLRLFGQVLADQPIPLLALLHAEHV
eukprot:1667540-Pyramimonas_sp.AAC.1